MTKKEVGTVIAGVGHPKGRKIDDIRFILELYGGAAEDWTKKKSSKYILRDLWGKPLSDVKIKGKLYQQRIECHWYENVKTGKRYDFKTKFLHEVLSDK